MQRQGEFSLDHLGQLCTCECCTEIQTWDQLQLLWSHSGARQDIGEAHLSFSIFCSEVGDGSICHLRSVAEDK